VKEFRTVTVAKTSSAGVVGNEIDDVRPGHEWLLDMVQYDEKDELRAYLTFVRETTTIEQMKESIDDADV
jgi:hypothetical protein